MLKYAFNLIDDGLVGQQLFAGEATRLAYGTDEAAEGRDAFLREAPARLVGDPVPLLMLRAAGPTAARAQRVPSVGGSRTPAGSYRAHHWWCRRAERANAVGPGRSERRADFRTRGPCVKHS